MFHVVKNHYFLHVSIKFDQWRHESVSVYLRAVAPVWIFAGGESAGGVDAGVLGGRILAGLPWRLPAQRGPVQRTAPIAASSRKRGRSVVPVKAHRLFSSLCELTAVWRVLPKMSAFVHVSVGARAFVRRIWPQVGPVAKVPRSPVWFCRWVEAAASRRRLALGAFYFVRGPVISNIVKFRSGQRGGARLPP